MARSVLLITLAATLPAEFEGLATLSDSDDPVAVAIEVVETSHGSPFKLFAADEALVAEHPSGAHCVKAMGAAHEASPSLATRFRRPFAALGQAPAALTARLVEFNAGNIAVAVQIEPVERATGALLTKLPVRLPCLVCSQAAVSVEIEAVETLRRPLGDLLAGNIRIPIAANVAGLGDGGAGER